MRKSQTGFLRFASGFRQVKSLRSEDMELLINGRSSKYRNIPGLRDAGVSIGALEKLAEADAFTSIGLDRRKALWEVSALADRPIGIFKGQSSESIYEKNVELPVMSASENVVQDYASLSLSLKAHPVSFVREKLTQLHIVSAKELLTLKDRSNVKVAGLVLVRQRPGTAGGVCFITIEDETGVANLVVFQNLFETYRKEILQSKLLMVEGKLQKERDVIHVIVKRCYDLTKLLKKLTPSNNENLPLLTLARPDEKDGTPFPAENKPTQIREKAQTEMFPKGRNFR